jgi:hypothetical protein
MMVKNPGLPSVPNKSRQGGPKLEIRNNFPITEIQMTETKARCETHLLKLPFARDLLRVPF